MRYVLKYTPTSDELDHSGIKGMRWGVRRYQNSDGTLTDAGRRRYSSARADKKKEAGKKAYDTAVKKHLLLHPGDASGARAAGVTAFRDAVNTTMVDRDEVFKEAVKKDLDATNTVLREGSNAAKTSATAVKNVRVNVPRMDLSSMTDQEMRARIQREQLESQYDQMFNTRRHSVENGKATIGSVLETVGSVATVAGSALSIALAIKELRK